MPAGDQRAEEVLRHGQDPQAAPDEQRVERQHERGARRIPSARRPRRRRSRCGARGGSSAASGSPGRRGRSSGRRRSRSATGSAGSPASPGSSDGLQERRQAVHLVGLEDVHAGRRRGDERERDRRRRRAPRAPAKCRHERAGDEQHGERDHDVDQAGAEVGLEHDERGRDEREQHRCAPWCRGRRSRRDAVDDERRQREDQQDLAQLGGLEARRTAGRSRGATRAPSSPSGDDEQDRADQQRRRCPYFSSRRRE